MMYHTINQTHLNHSLLIIKYSELEIIRFAFLQEHAQITKFHNLGLSDTIRDESKHSEKVTRSNYRPVKLKKKENVSIGIETWYIHKEDQGLDITSIIKSESMLFYHFNSHIFIDNESNPSIGSNYKGIFIICKLTDLESIKNI